ncbi:MAG: cupin-like domain-containing protein [Mycobacterium sp.]
MQQLVQRIKGPTRADIPRASGTDIPAALELHRRSQVPLLLEGAAAEWAAVNRWSPAYLAEVVGDIQVTPSVGLPDTEVPYNHRAEGFCKPMTVHEFVKLMGTGDRCYIGQAPIRILPGLERDFDFASLASLDIKEVVLWMGASTRSGMHYDNVDNLFAQVHGTKLAILAAPEEAFNLHLFPDSHSKSQVAPEHPDLKAHPRFARAKLMQATLEPGDVLFLPRAWWHYFASSPSSISLACWHGELLTPRYDLQVMMRMRSPKAWALLVRDFAVQAMDRPADERLFSPPSTGRQLYQLASTMWSRRKH